jgi:hypothetical protein
MAEPRFASSPFRALLVLLVLGWGWAAPARADFHSNAMFPVGESAGLMGGAAVAWVSDGSAAWYNPAGLGVASERTLSASVSAYGIQSLRVANFVDFGMQDGLDRKANLRSSAVATFPSYVGYVQNFGKSARFHQGLGFAVVVPDFERADALLDTPTQALNNSVGAIEFRARIKLTAQTIWGMPGWGGCWADGKLCVGVGLALGYRTDISTSIVDSRVLLSGNALSGQLVVDQHDLWMALVGGTGGVQWQVLPALRLGASVRTPVRSVVAGGSLIHSEADANPTASTQLSRVEEQKPRLEYDLPLQIRAGASLVLGGLHLAADVNFSPAQASIPFIRGRFGETALQPTYFGMPIGQPVDISADLERDAIVDAAIGAEYSLPSGYGMTAGLFTNFTGAAAGSDDNIYGDRLGITFGGVRRSGRSTTRLGGTVVFGGGSITGQSVQGGKVVPVLVDTSSVALYLTVGGTADL